MNENRELHEELLAQKGLYYGTYVAQMGTAPEKRKQV